MGLLTILKKIKQKEKEIRILILGLDNAGKTTILRKICGEPIDRIEPTLGFNISSLQHGDGYTLNLWDVGGQKSIRAYWRNYFESSTDGIIWVVDSTDQQRMTTCHQELVELLQQERLLGASSLLILANKQDVAGALTADDIAECFDLHRSDDEKDDKAEQQQYYQHRHWRIQPCSAVTGEGLMDGIDWIVQDIASRIFLLS